MVFKKGLIPYNKGKNYSENNKIGKCKTCGKEFQYYKENQAGLFCSRECYQKSVAIPQKRCIICGEIYTPDKGNKDKWERSKYCSNSCANKGKFKGSYIPCRWCGKSIWKHPYKLKTNKHNFCSKECFNAFKQGKNNVKNYKKGYRAEVEARKILEKEGYRVIRNHLSWGEWDLCAIGHNHLRFIQVKSSRRKYKISQYGKDIKKLSSYDVPDFASKEIWHRSDYSGWERYTLEKGVIKPLEKEDLDKIPKLNSGDLVTLSENPFLRRRGINDFITIVNSSNKTIKMISCKSGRISDEKIETLKNALKDLNGNYSVNFSEYNLRKK